MATFKLLSGSAAINAAIESIKRRGDRLRSDIHKAAVSCLAHVEEHGDVTVMTSLANALPQGANVKRLRMWAEAHGKVYWDDESKAFAYRKNATTNLDGAMEVHPFDFQKAETEKAAFDFAEAVAKLVKRAETEKVDAELVAKLKAVIA